MSRRLLRRIRPWSASPTPVRPTEADGIEPELEPVWEELAAYASAAPRPRSDLGGRVFAAVAGEAAWWPRGQPDAQPARIVRAMAIVRSLVRPTSLRSLGAAAAMVVLLGVGVALAGASVARLTRALEADNPPSFSIPRIDEDEATGNEGPQPAATPENHYGPDDRDNPDPDADADEEGGEDADEEADEDAEQGDNDAGRPEVDDEDNADEPAGGGGEDAPETGDRGHVEPDGPGEPDED